MFNKKYIWVYFYLSLFFVSILPLYNLLYLYPAFYDVIKTNSEEEAVIISKHIEKMVFPQNKTVIKDSSINSTNITLSHKRNIKFDENFFSDQVKKNIKLTVNEFKVKKLRIYTPEFKIIYSTESNEFGKKFKSSHGNVDKIYSKFLEKGASTAENETIETDIVEIHIPIFYEKKVIGITDIIFDVSDRKNRLDTIVRRSTTFLILITSTILIIVFIISLRMRKAEIVRKKFEKALLRSKKFNETILNSMNEEVFIMDLNDRKIIGVNIVFLNQHGVKYNDIIGKSCNEISEEFVKDNYEHYKFDEVIPVVMKGETVINEHVHNTISGERIAEFSISPVKDEEGNINRAVFVSRDITERKRLERLKANVERIVRHDLRTPLNGIIGFSQMLSSKELKIEEQKKFASYILASGYKMLHMIDNSLDVFKIEEGTYILKPEKINLVEIFYKLDKEFHHIKKRRSIELIYLFDNERMSRENELIIQGETILLENLFANLINNAIEASPENGTVTVTVKDNSLCAIDIHNNGVIPEEIRNNFFGKYTTSGKEKGTGLGTYSAMLIANAHEGDIYFTTSEKEGTHIIIKLPKGPTV